LNDKLLFLTSRGEARERRIFTAGDASDRKTAEDNSGRTKIGPVVTLASEMRPRNHGKVQNRVTRQQYEFFGSTRKVRYRWERKVRYLFDKAVLSPVTKVYLYLSLY
jgi:hypothetical protein